MKKVIIAGGTGFLGRKLSDFLKKHNYHVDILSRSSSSNSIKYPQTLDEMTKLIENYQIVINLAGASVAGKRWNDEYKKELYNSRIDTTKFLVDAINKAENPPELLISNSAIGYYGDRGEEIITEESSPSDGFIAKICIDWEQEAKKVRSETRLVIPRIGVVLDKGKGALEKMEGPFQLFIGGPIGSGKQYFSWIDIDDLLKAFLFMMENEISGEFNLTSPNPVRMNEFARALGKAMDRPSFFRVPSFILKIILGESSEEILRSQRIIPQRLMEKNLVFEYGNIEKSLKKIYKK